LIWIISIVVVWFIILESKVKFVNLVQLEFLFIILVMVSIFTRLRLFLWVIILSGVSRVIFMIIYIKKL